MLLKGTSLYSVLVSDCLFTLLEVAQCPWVPLVLSSVFKCPFVLGGVLYVPLTLLFASLPA